MPRWRGRERASSFAASAVGPVGVTYQIISDGAGRAGRGRVTIAIVSSKFSRQHGRTAAEAQRFRRRPALRAVMRANRRAAWRAGRAGQHVPAQVSELLVDALKSHGV